MKKSRILIPAVVLVLCIGVWMGLRSYNRSTEQKTEEQEEKAQTVLSVPAEDIQSFSFMSGGNTYEFVKKEDVWSYTGDKNFPVDEDQVEELLSSFEQVEAVRVLQDVTDLSEYGLSEPSNVITLKDREGTVYTLSIGNLNSSTGDYYVSAEEEHTVYTIDSTIPLNFQIGLYDLARTEDFPSIDSSEVTALKVYGKESEFSAFLDEGSSTAWSVADARNQYEGDEESLTELVDGLGSLRYDSCLEYDCQNMEAYGLENPSYYLMIEYTEISSNSSEEEEEDSAQRQVLFAVGARDEDGRYFVSREGSGEVHTISASSLEPFLSAEADTYRSHLLSYATMDEVAEVTLNYQGKAYTFIQTERTEENEEGQETTSYSCIRNGADFDVDTYQSFFKIARGMKAQSYTQEAPTEEESFSLIFERKNGTVRTVSYHPYDDNFYLAAVDDSQYALVNKMDVNTLEEYVITVTR